MLECEGGGVIHSSLEQVELGTFYSILEEAAWGTLQATLQV